MEKLNIKVVHLLLYPDFPEDIPKKNWESTMWKQKKSLECWENMSHKFSSYIKRYTKVNRTELPTDTCAEPEIIDDSKEFKNEPPVLSYGHYGAYRAHKEGILENFSEDVDILIIVEGDVVTDLSPDEFYNKIIEGYKISKTKDARLVTLAGPFYMGSWDDWWDKTTDLGDWYQVPHFILGSTYMIMKNERENIINKLNNTKWHSPDIWLVNNYHDTVPILTSKENVVYQLEGYSVLDYKEKDTWVVDNKENIDETKKMEKFNNIDEQRFWNDESNWTEGGHEWSGIFGTTENLWNKHLFDDIKDYRGKNILEIAPGFGRITQFLSILAGELIVVDMNDLCLRKTKEKLEHHVLAYIQNNGNDLPKVRDNSQDLVFSFDSFVHMHENVIDDYLKEINRVLVKGGRGFIHHSHLYQGSEYSFNNNGGRSNMNPERFRELVENNGMKLIHQRPIKISEGNERWSAEDTISIFEK